MRASDGRPRAAIWHIEHLADVFEGVIGQGALQFQAVGMLQQLPGQLADEALFARRVVGQGLGHFRSVGRRYVQREQQLLDGLLVQGCGYHLRRFRGDFEAGSLSDINVVEGEPGEAARRAGQCQVGCDLDILRIQFAVGESFVEKRLQALFDVGGQVGNVVEVVLVVAGAVVPLLQQFEVSLLFLDGGHAQPGR